MLQEFVQSIENVTRAMMSEIHTALPGVIVSFDAATGTAIVQPKGKFVTSAGKKLDYPKLLEAPVVFPFSATAGAGIAFPVKAGDGCIAIISEVELDEWRTGAESTAPLKFDLSSAMIIPGLCMKQSALVQKANSENAVVIQNGSSNVLVKSGGVTLNGTVTINGAATINGGTTINGNLKVNGDATANHHYTG